MTNSLILLIEVGLLALLPLLAFRMLTLVRNDPFVPATPAPSAEFSSQPLPLQPTSPKRVDTGHRGANAAPDKCELITQLHILLSIQERDCREKGLELRSAPSAVKEYVAAWLYGAACAVCDKSQRHSGAMLDVVSQLVSRKTGLRQPEAVQALSTLTDSATLLACFRYGVEGAEYWSEHRYVPQENSLYSAITSNAFI